ncbi:hypothetical protein [Methanomethylovorans sp.]|uniref:hypothetical protein n=1 Tax=Methanomethylovorans sp. TaxID=2758717 RepID=UPI003D119626
MQQIRYHTIHDLSQADKARIVKEAPIKCHRELANEYNVKIGTIRRVVMEARQRDTNS